MNVVREIGEQAVTSSVDCRYFLSLRQIIFWEHQTVELWMLWPTVCLTSILFLLIQDQVATYTCRGEEVQIKALKLHSEHQKRCSSVLLHKRSYIICGLKKWGDIRTLNLIFSQQIRITWGLRSKLGYKGKVELKEVIGWLFIELNNCETWCR